MKCYKCWFYNRDFITDEKSKNPKDQFCGLHGRAKVDPNAEKHHLGRNNDCGGFIQKEKLIQLDLFNNQN